MNPHRLLISRLKQQNRPRNMFGSRSIFGYSCSLHVYVHNRHKPKHPRADPIQSLTLGGFAAVRVPRSPAIGGAGRGALVEGMGSAGVRFAKGYPHAPWPKDVNKCVVEVVTRSFAGATTNKESGQGSHGHDHDPREEVCCYYTAHSEGAHGVEGLVINYKVINLLMATELKGSVDINPSQFCFPAVPSPTFILSILFTTAFPGSPSYPLRTFHPSPPPNYTRNHAHFTSSKSARLSLPSLFSFFPFCCGFP